MTSASRAKQHERLLRVTGAAVTLMVKGGIHSRLGTYTFVIYMMAQLLCTCNISSYTCHLHLRSSFISLDLTNPESEISCCNPTLLPSAGFCTSKQQFFDTCPFVESSRASNHAVIPFMMNKLTVGVHVCIQNRCLLSRTLRMQQQCDLANGATYIA